MKKPVSNMLYERYGHMVHDLRRIEWIRSLAQGPTPLVVIDPRGIGGCVGKSCGSRAFLEPCRLSAVFRTDRLLAA